MPKVSVSRDIPSHKQRIEDRKRKAQVLEEVEKSVKGRKFSSLSSEDKDALLKVVAARLGLVEED